MSFLSDSGHEIPDSFQTSSSGWKTMPTPNFAGQTEETNLFENTQATPTENLFENHLTQPEDKLQMEGTAEQTVFSGMNYNSLTGIALGEANNRLMDSFSQNQYNTAIQGKGPLGSDFTNVRNAEDTMVNQNTATTLAGAALSIGGMFGPEGLAVGATVAAGIDIATATGAFDAAPPDTNTI